MVSAENVAWLNATGRRYVIGTARSELKRWSKEIAEKDDWRQIRDDVEGEDLSQSGRHRNVLAHINSILDVNLR